MVSDSASPLEVTCPTCGKTNLAGAKFCQECGETLQSSGGLAGATVAISVDALRQMREQEGRAQSSTDGHRVAFRTDIGKKHHINQDSGNAWTWLRDDGTPASLLIVADGVSAGRHSEEASRHTVDVIRERVSSLLQESSADVESVLEQLVDAIKQANHEIASRPHSAISNADATTIVTAFSIGDRLAGAWVGDSRVYRVHGEEITRLTVDHSWAEGVISRGIMTPEQASRDPRAHMIMRWLGPPDQDDPGVESFQVDLEPADVVFCCTDGLYMYFAPPVADEEELARIVISHGPDLAAAVDEMVDIALARGGYDNITVAVLRLPADDESKDEDEPETEELPESTTEHRPDQTVQLRFPRRE